MTNQHSIPVVAVVQARMGSVRLPGKVLRRLGSLSILDWIILRLQSSKLLRSILVVTSEQVEDDAIYERCQDLGIVCYRGSKEDVLSRFISVFDEYSECVIVRVCADSPFVCAEAVDAAVRKLASTGSSYVYNNCPKSCDSGKVDGLGVEAFLLSELRVAAEAGTDSEMREHVTSVLRSKAGIHQWADFDGDTSSQPCRLDVDRLEDLIWLQYLVENGVGIESSASHILHIVESLQRTPFNPSNHSSICSQMQLDLQSMINFPRSLMGPGVERTIRKLSERIPMRILKVPSGTELGDWKVPQEWTLRGAKIISMATGEVMVDSDDNILHVVNYSEPVDKVLPLKELISFLHVGGTGIPYRTAYYSREWGFCVTQEQFEKINAIGGDFLVLIDSEFHDSHMLIADSVIRGESSQEILISSYICHPNMANDSLSGVVLACHLAKCILESGRKPKYTLRFVFAPETIGALGYLDYLGASIQNISFGFLLTTVGLDHQEAVKKSFESDHLVNDLIAQVFDDLDHEIIEYPFDIHGSDERQYSSPGVRLNMASIFKGRYYDYSEYHTSADNLSIVKAENIGTILSVYLKIFERIDLSDFFYSKLPYGEAMLSKHDLYAKVGGAFVSDCNEKIPNTDLLLWLMFFADGTYDSIRASRRLGVSQHRVKEALCLLESKGLIHYGC